VGWFDGKAAVVTGAAMGIGRETARLIAAQGAAVMCADVNLGAMAEVVELITDAGGKAAMIKTDVSDPKQCEEMVAATVETFGGLNLAVNNAGVTTEWYTTVTHPIEEWRRIMSVNIDGVFYCLKYEIPEMLKVGGGSIVNVASILGLVGFETGCAYTAAKHGVVGLTKTAAIEFAQQGVRINAVNPGFIMTPMQTNAGIQTGDETYNYLAGKHPMNRMGDPEEVAYGIAWLLSDEASFLTGISMPIDGGYTAQ